MQGFGSLNDLAEVLSEQITDLNAVWYLVNCRIQGLALYKVVVPSNGDYGAKGRSYVPGPDSCLYSTSLPAKRMLSGLAQGFGDGEPMQFKAWVPSRVGHCSCSALGYLLRQRSGTALRTTACAVINSGSS